MAIDTLNKESEEVSMVVLDYCNGTVNHYEGLKRSEIGETPEIWIEENTSHRITDISYMIVETPQIEVNYEKEN